jgi:hypothetical protein
MASFSIYVGEDNKILSDNEEAQPVICDHDILECKGMPRQL